MKTTKPKTKNCKRETRKLRTGTRNPPPDLSAETRGLPADITPALAATIEQLLSSALTLEKYAVEEGRITVNAISLALGAAPSSMHYALRELRLETQLERRRQGAGRRGLSITLADAKIPLGSHLAPRRHTHKPTAAAEPPLARPQFGVGYFYIVLLEPELDSGRFKIGYTRTLKQRLTAFRTCAPYGEYLFHWPCQRAWELTARAFITRYCEHLREEVYRTRDIPALLARAAHFFVEMPDVRRPGSPRHFPKANE